MVDGEVNRGEWACIVRDLLAERTKGKKAPFARLVGVDPSTVDNWLDQKGDVAEASVRKVARAFDLSAIELLIRVGLYARSEIPPTLAPEAVDEEQRRVLDATDLDDETKMLILQQLDDMRATDERLVEEQRERDKRRRLRELEHLIEQARRSA